MALDSVADGMNKACSEQHLAEISRWITEWKEISPFLGLTQAEELEIIGSAPNSVRSQKIAMLRSWKQKQGSKATYKRLCRAFRKCGLRDLEEKVIELLAESSSSSDEASEGITSSVSLLGAKAMHSNSLSSSSHPDTVISYECYLRELYMSMSHSQTPQHWTHLPRCNFIQLAIVRAQRLRCRQEEKIVKLSQQGKIEKIMHYKKTISLNQLFSSHKDCDTCPSPPPPSPLSLSPSPLSHADPLESLDLLSLLRPHPRTILIEGAPGGGKSTLALHICHQWAQGASWLAKFDIVIFAYLRDEGIQNANTLVNIIPARTLEMSESIAAQIKATDGKNTLFVFDGWDEFPPKLMGNSLVSTIIRQPQKLSLHLSTVLITSRPSSGDLLQTVDQRVEILGFTQHQIREFIEKALDGNSAHIQKLFCHLDKHPVIKSCCYVPLHAAILVHIFKIKQGALPTTLHELFCSLVLCCIVREQETHEPDTSLPDLSSFDDLPDDLMSNLSNLSLLAYEGVMHNKIVFYPKDLQSSHLPTELPSLGLLQIVEGLTLTSKSRSYNFLYLSVQELLAAYHISLMSPSEQVEVLKELLIDNYRFKAVLRYYCGFTKLANPEIKEFIFSYQHEMSSLKDLLPLLHCFFEAQQPSLCQLVNPKLQKKLKINCLNLIPSDYLAIGYYVTSLLSSSTNKPTVHLLIDDSVICKGRTNLKLLLSELSKYPIGGLPTAAGASSRKLVFYLGYMRIDHGDDVCCCETDEYDDYYDDTRRGKIFITAQQAKLIASHLKQSSAINELELYDGDIQRTYDEDGLLYIAEALQTNTSLTKLRLHMMKLRYREPSGSALTRMLHVNMSLTHLDLSMNDKLSDSGSCCIFKGLQYNTSLTHLNLEKTGIRAKDTETARSLTKMLQMNKSLTHLNLSYNCFLKSRACCIFKGLQQNTALTHLRLSNTSIAAINCDTARCLTKMLQVNKSLTYLDLSDNNTFSDLEACCIFEGLQRNTSLIYLDLSHRGIHFVMSSNTANCLSKMLEVNKTLRHLSVTLRSFRRMPSLVCILLKAFKDATSS